MALNNDEQALLSLIVKSPVPVAISDFFPNLNPPDAGLNQHHPGWTERKIELFRVSLGLHEQGLVRVVEPANGERPDLVEATPAGHNALTS